MGGSSKPCIEQICGRCRHHRSVMLAAPYGIVLMLLLLLQQETGYSSCSYHHMYCPMHQPVVHLFSLLTVQIIQPAMLREGFELVRERDLEVTDDVSIIEALGHPVQITPGSYTNIKVRPLCKHALDKPCLLHTTFRLRSCVPLCR